MTDAGEEFYRHAVVMLRDAELAEIRTAAAMRYLERAEAAEATEQAAADEVQDAMQAPPLHTLPVPHEAPPGGESLRDTAARVLPYYIQEMLPRVLQGNRVLVSAHGNSLRALVMVLDRHTPESITQLNLDTGVPMIYRLNADATVASKLDLAA